MIFWNEDRKALVRGMKAEGLSLREIALEFGVSRAAVSGIVHRLKPKLPKRAPRPKRQYTSRNRTDHTNKVSAPIRAPFAGDDSCPDFAWDDDHCTAVLARGGYPVLERRPS